MSIFWPKIGGKVSCAVASWVRLRTVIIALLLLSCCCGTLWAAEIRVSITHHQGFKQLRNSLEALVAAEGKDLVSNHFFIATYPPERKFTYMLWREGRALWILELGDKSPHHWESIISTPRSGTRIDIDKDVIDNPGTSTYLVGSAWIKNIVYDTVLNGDLVVIRKNPKGRGD